MAPSLVVEPAPEGERPEPDPLVSAHLRDWLHRARTRAVWLHSEYLAAASEAAAVSAMIERLENGGPIQ